MAFTKMRALVKKDLQHMGTYSASGVSPLDKAKEVSAAFAEPIGAGLRLLGKSVYVVLNEIGKIDVAIGDALGFAQIEEQFRFSQKNNLKMNQVAIELVGVRMRHINKRYNLGIEGYETVYSFENFQGSEVKQEIYNKMSMEGINNVISKILSKIGDFFSKLWSAMKDGIESAVSLRKHLLKKIEAYEQSIPHIDTPIKDKTFKSSKKMRDGICETRDFTIDSVKEQNKRQKKAFELVNKFTKKILSDLKTFESSFRSDPVAGMAKLADDLLEFKEFSFGTNKEPLGGMVYYDVSITDEDNSNVRVTIQRQKAAVVNNSNAMAETLTVEEMEGILDSSKTLLSLSDIAFDTYQETYGNLQQVKKLAMRDLKKVPDKELSSLAKSYLTLYEGLFSLCPALAILVLDTNLKMVNGSLSYIDESLKCY